MIVLVDYDNVERQTRRQGPLHVVRKLLRCIEKQLTGERNVTCRLYGGWRTQDNLSRNAENLIPRIKRDFPDKFRPRNTAISQTLSVTAELAQTLACHQAEIFTHTHRQRSIPKQLHCQSVPFKGCIHPSKCPIYSLDYFINYSTCPKSNCSVGLSNALRWEEQKLVDSMLIVDLIYFAQTTKESLVVVSSDDDIWPGIRFVLLQNARLIHVLTRPRQADIERYRVLESDNYQRFPM